MVRGTLKSSTKNQQYIGLYISYNISQPWLFLNLDQQKRLVVEYHKNMQLFFKNFKCLE